MATLTGTTIEVGGNLYEVVNAGQCSAHGQKFLDMRLKRKPREFSFVTGTQVLVWTSLSLDGVAYTIYEVNTRAGSDGNKEYHAMAIEVV